MACTPQPAYGSLAALAAAVTAPAGLGLPTAASSLDACLLAAVAELLTVLRLEADQAAALDSEDTTIASPAFDHCDEHIWPRLDVLVDRVMILRPATTEGLRQKLAVAIYWLHRSVKMESGRNFEEQAQRHELLAMVLLRQVAGGGIKA